MEKKKSIVRQYCPADISVTGSCQLENSFFAELKGTFKGPNGEKLIIPGFYDGNNIWKVRFAPVSIGTWRFSIQSPDIALEHYSGELECVPNENPNIHGGIIVNPDYPYHFMYEDGTSYFMMAYECDWLWAMDMEDSELKKVKELIKIVKQYGYNQIIMNIYTHDTPWAPGKTSDCDYGPPALYLWEGSNEYPDHSRLNISFFAHYDRVIRYLQDEGISVHLFFKVYSKMVKWPVKASAEDKLYFKYLVARYQAFSNVIWDFSKEAYFEEDKEYILRCMELIRDYDAYQRLRTVHDDRIFHTYKNYTEVLNFHTIQQHNDFYSTILLARAKKQWPVFNAEYSYDKGLGRDVQYAWTVQDSEEVIRRTYEIVMAGGYPGYYYDYTAFDVIDYRYIPKGYDYFKILHDFFTSIDWWKMEPHPELIIWHGRCLAEVGKVYVFYVDRNRVCVNMSSIGEISDAYWLNTHTGERVAMDDGSWYKHPAAPNLYVFNNPFIDTPAIFHFKVKGQ